MKNWIVLGCLITANASATLVTGPDNAYVITSRGTAGYTISSLSGKGNTVVQKMPNGYILLESDQVPTMIYEDGVNQIEPVVPVEQGLDMEISE